jgi:hypothetical protein
MDKNLITITEYQELLNRLDGISKQLSAREKITKERWLDNQEFMQLLKISRRTSQSHRDNNLIAYSIIGNKIYYKVSDVEALLENHYQRKLK